MMRRRKISLLALLTLTIGCPLAHEDLDLRRCFEDTDCFIAEGEYCAPIDRTSGEPGSCMLKDGGPPDTALSDLPPAPDFPVTDLIPHFEAGVDADQGGGDLLPDTVPNE